MVCDNWRSVLRPPICGQSTSSDVCQIQQATRHADNPPNCTIKSTPNTKKIQQSMIPATRVIQKSNIKRISKFQLYTKTDSSGVHALDFDDAVELHVAEQRTRQFLIFFSRKNFITKSMQRDDKEEAASKFGKTQDQNQFQRVARLAVILLMHAHACAPVSSRVRRCVNMPAEFIYRNDETINLLKLHFLQKMGGLYVGLTLMLTFNMVSVLFSTKPHVLPTNYFVCFSNLIMFVMP